MEITEEDLTGELEGFPIEVVKKMLERQVEQGCQEDVGIFQIDNCRGRDGGGFSWRLSDEDWSFWHEVIAKKKFDVFFKRYPSDITESKDEEKGILGFFEDIVDKYGIPDGIDTKNELRPFTPVMCYHCELDKWELRYYTSKLSEEDVWGYIVPFDRFDPKDIEKSTEYDVKNRE